MSTQIMNPSDEAQKVEPTKVQSAAASDIPRASTAIPPAMPARPNQGGTLRALNAASEEPMITVAAQAAPGAAISASREASAAACSASREAPPSTTMLAKKPSG